MQNIRASGFQSLSNPLAIALPEEELITWCDHWKVQELYLFGSVLRDDFQLEDSDIDIMVKFSPEASWGFEFVSMKQELENLFNRKVDLLTKASVEKSQNWIRRKEILETAKLVYVAG